MELGKCCFKILTTSLMLTLSDSCTVSMLFIRFFNHSDTFMCGGNEIYFFMRSIRTFRWSVFSHGNRLYRIL